jgi:hypothetical protein
MCDRRLRDLKRDLSTLAAEFAAGVEISRTARGHFRARFTVRAMTFDFIMASTPSDWRGQHNDRARVRRVLRTAKERG